MRAFIGAEKFPKENWDDSSPIMTPCVRVATHDVRHDRRVRDVKARAAAGPVPCSTAE
jgi:hypothetical protein